MAVKGVYPMKKRSLLIIAAALVTVSTSISLPLAQEEQALTASRRSPINVLEGRLLKLGEEYDVYFTLETAWGDGESTNWMENQKVEDKLMLSSAMEELERLRQTVPHFTYTVDPNNPKIIHIIDARLAQQKGYGLENTLDSIDYKGTLGGMITSLNSHGVTVSTVSLTAIGDKRPRDNSTIVHVKGQNINVRRAITDFIPLEERRRGSFGLQQLNLIQ